MKFVQLLAVLVALFAFVVNAQETKPSDKQEDEEEQEQKEEVVVNYEVIQQGTYSGKKDVVAQVITSQKDWDQLWKQHVSVLVPQPPVPSIDFESEVVVAIFAGEKKTGGYAAVVRDVSAELDNVIVKYLLTEPQPNSMNLQVITQPYVMLKMDKPKGTVKLVKE